MMVLVVDSSVLIIERLQHILTEEENVSVVYGAVSYKDAMRIFKENETPVVLLDSDLPHTMSSDLLKEIKTTKPDTKVIMMVNAIEKYSVEKYKGLGADLFFDKYHEFETIPG